MRRTTISRIMLVLLIVTLSAPAVAGAGRWTSSGPQGGFITALATDSADASIVYAATAGGGVFRSSTDTPHWVAVNEGLPELVITALAVYGDVSPPTSETIW